MSSTVPRLSLWIVALLSGASALGPASMQILLPALPVIREDFIISPGTAQLTLSLSMLSIAIATLFYGPISDRFGRKPTLIAGTIITFMGSLFCLAAPTVELLILGRIIQAFGGAVGLVVARAIVRDVYGPQESAKIISTLVMVMVVIPMLSPALGGELMVLFGWRSVFVVIALFSALILVIMHLHLPETLVEPAPFEGIGGMLRTFQLLLQSRVFRGYGFSVAFVSVVFFSFISAAPEIMVTVLGRPATEYGYYFVMIPAGFMAGNYLSRRFGGRLSIYQLIDTGSKISLAGITVTLLFQAYGFHHPIFLFFPIAVAVFGNGMTLPNAQAGAINEFPRQAGSASGLTGFLQMGLSAAAAQLVAVIFNETAYPLLILMFCASLASLLCFRFGVGKPDMESLNEKSNI